MAVGGVERRLLDVVKKQISADPTVSGKSREIYIFFLSHVIADNLQLVSFGYTFVSCSSHTVIYFL